MKYETLNKLLRSDDSEIARERIKALLFKSKSAKVKKGWNINQKWLVHSYLFINRNTLKISMEASQLKKASYFDEHIMWVKFMEDNNLCSRDELFNNLISYYESILEFIENNGGWSTVDRFLISRGHPQNNVMNMHAVDIMRPIEDVDKLSEDQEMIMNHLGEKQIIILAGPGAGKTTTLTHLVSRIPQDKRVLILMFNVAAKQEFRKKLIQRGLTVRKSISREIIENHRIVVSTIHGYAYHILPRQNRFSSGGLVDFSISKDYIGSIKWDYCIVDEAQDLDSMLYDNVISRIHCDHMIYAGDYRQNVRGESKILDKIISESNVYHIRDNHRSGSRIVECLNEYSNFNYDDIVNIEQVSSVKDQGEVMVIETEDISEDICKYLIDYDPGDTFIIAPISIESYGLSKVSTRLYNTLLSMGYNDRYASLHRYIPSVDKVLHNDKDYFITSKSAKGLERRQVILIGIDKLSMYTASKSERIDISTLKSHIFVGMSRAIERVIILIRKDNYEDKFPITLTSDETVKHFLSPLVGKSIKSRYIPRRDEDDKRIMPIWNVSVLADKLEHYTKHLYDINRLTTFIPPEILDDESYQISNYIGIYVEARIADHYGLLRSKYLCVPSDMSEIPKIYMNRDNDTYIIEVPGVYSDSRYKRKLRQWQEYADNLLNYPQLMYRYIAMKLYMDINHEGEDKINELVKRFMKIDIDLSDVYEFIDSNKSDNMLHQRRHIHRIYSDRSENIGEYSCFLKGFSDLSDDDNIFEIKHSSYSNQHGYHNGYLQSLLYGHMTPRRSIVINTKLGEIHEITPIADRNTIDKIIRANIYVSMARKFPHNQTNLVPIKHRYIISLDYEFNTYSAHAMNIYEKAALVYDTENEVVVDAIQLVHKDAEEDTDIDIDTPGAQCHRFKADKFIGKDPELEKSFRNFIDKYPDSYIMHWAGNESRDFPNKTCIDMRKYFSLYRTNTLGILSIEEFNSSLGEALESLVGNKDILLLYHRAFDDSIASLLVYISLISSY